MQPNYQNQDYRYNYQSQGFAPEAPQQTKSKKGTSLAVKIVLIFVIVGMIIFSLPFIICGAFLNPIIPIVVIVILVFAIKGLKKFL